MLKPNAAPSSEHNNPPRRSPSAAKLLAPPILIAMGLWMLLVSLFVHELGHVLGALATDGRVVSLELRPGRLGHTLVNPNPSPEVVLWSGLLFGWVAPFATWPAWRLQRGLIGPTLRATTWFSWLALGSYLAVGGGERWSDTGQLMSAGWSALLLVALGSVVAMIGYAGSRHAWSILNERLETLANSPDAAPHGVARLAAGWWTWLVLWWVLQHAAGGAIGSALGLGIAAEP
ncbi:hypothetical protein Pla111_29380 [Botrimarina hoheduenensis]|uniref:Uncharacterized protein n=2 Tax=Botrimarina hoheduenensis TaxID=2528000 RepID=A0A5C5VVD2_9BACT|nr:hypothetical protein Pla111_29380 [Botrimarina hoheduenensis]